MRRLRVGVVGLGAIAQIHHLPALERSRDRFELAHVCDLSPTLLGAIASRYRVARATTRWQDVCDDDSLDAVILLSSGAHGPQAQRALAQGRHVLAEKPLCYTRREARDLQALADSNGLVLQIGYMKAYEAVMPQAQAAVSDLGELRLVQHSVLHPSETAQQEHMQLLRFDDADPDVLASLRREDDALLDEAIGVATPGLRWLYCELALGSIVHYLAVSRALFGRLPRPIRWADAWPLDLDTPPRGWGSHDVLPTLSVLADLAPDCRVELTWAWLQRYPEYTERVNVLGPEGAVEIALPPPYVHHRTAEVTMHELAGQMPVRRRVGGAYDVAFARELEQFHAAVTDGAPVFAGAAAGGDDAAWCQELVAAIAQSRGVSLGGEAAQHDGRSLSPALRSG